MKILNVLFASQIVALLTSVQRCGGSGDDPSVIVQQMLTGHHELVQSDPCPGCCDPPSESDSVRLQTWLKATEEEIDAMLRHQGRHLLSSQDDGVSGRRAVSTGLCLLKACASDAAALKRCELTRVRALQLRLKLSWALLMRGERAELASAVLNDALALVESPRERRVVLEHHAWVAVRMGEFELAARYFKTAVSCVDEELTSLGESRGGSHIIQLHRRKRGLSESDAETRLMEQNAEGGDGGDGEEELDDDGGEVGATTATTPTTTPSTAVYAEDAVLPVADAVRSLQHVAMVLEWRLGCALLCGGRQVESLHYLRAVVEQAGDGWNNVVAAALHRAPREEGPNRKKGAEEASSSTTTTTATTTATARPPPQRRSGGRKRARNKAAKAATALELSDGELPLSQEWLVWHALRMVDLPAALPLVPNQPFSCFHGNSNSGRNSSAATGSVDQLSFELRGLRRFLGRHRHLEASARHQLGRALYKKGFTAASSRHLAAAYLPWEREAVHVPQRLALALTLPVVSLSERDLAVGLAAAEDDLSALLLDSAHSRRTKAESVAAHRTADAPVHTHFSSHGGSSIGGSSADAFGGGSGGGSGGPGHRFTVSPSDPRARPSDVWSSGGGGGGDVPFGGERGSGLLRATPPAADHAGSHYCAGVHPREVLSVQGGLAAALELWPLEYWAGHYPQDEIEAILGEPLVHDTNPAVVSSLEGGRHRRMGAESSNSSSGSSSGGGGGSKSISKAASNARPPLGAVLARLVLSVCPALGYPRPKPPVPPASPPPFEALRTIQRQVDAVKAKFLSSQLGPRVGGLAVSGAVKPPAPAPVHVPPLVVGVVASRMRNHAAARLVAGWIRHLSTSSSSASSSSASSSSAPARQVKTLAMCFPTAVDHWTRLLLQLVDGTVNLVPDLAESAKRIKRAAPDVLLFVDLPLDWRSFALASLRLAPVQVAFWGHTHSTHLPSVDYFVLPPGAAPQVTAATADDDDDTWHANAHNNNHAFLAESLRRRSSRDDGPWDSSPRSSGDDAVGEHGQEEKKKASTRSCSPVHPAVYTLQVAARGGSIDEYSGVCEGNGMRRGHRGVGYVSGGSDGGANRGEVGGVEGKGKHECGVGTEEGKASGECVMKWHGGGGGSSSGARSSSMHPLLRNGFEAPAVHLLGRQLEQPVLVGGTGAGSFYDPLEALRLNLELNLLDGGGGGDGGGGNPPSSSGGGRITPTHSPSKKPSSTPSTAAAAEADEDTVIKSGTIYASNQDGAATVRKRKKKRTKASGRRSVSSFSDPLSPSSAASSPLLSRATSGDDKLFDWVVPFEDLRKKLHLPEAQQQQQQHTMADKKVAGRRPLLLPAPYVVLPVRTHQWHPEFDHAVAKLLLLSSRLSRSRRHNGQSGGQSGGGSGNDDEEDEEEEEEARRRGNETLHVVVVAEWTLVEGTGDGDAMTRHDIHQHASPYAWERRLRQRLASRFPSKRRKELMARVHWLAPLPTRDYLSVVFHARACLDTFPVANPVGSLDALAVGTPLVTAPLLQRQGFRLGASFWQGLLAGCSADTLNATLYDSSSGSGGSSNDRGSRGREGEEDAKRGWAQGQGNLRSFFLAPVVEDAVGMAQAAIALADRENPWGGAVREVVVACRGALFHDAKYARDLRRFLLNAAKATKPSGELYPAGGPRADVGAVGVGEESNGDAN